MNRSVLTIKENVRVNASVYRMTLEGNCPAHRSGQFVEIELDGLFLRRPISVCDSADGSLTLLYKVVGKGTAQMAAMTAGQTLDVLCSLGNGFDTSVPCRTALLVGGGIGVAPLYQLAKELISQGKKVEVILGFNKADEVIFADEFAALGADVTITTADGSVGVKGFVTNALEGSGAEYFYACGPMPMLRALNGACALPGQVSLEERMGCGVGICMGCTCKTMLGAKRVCKEGPVFKKEEVIW